MREFWEFVKKHMGAFIGGAVGLIFGILLLTIGFWPVLLLFVLCSAGVIIGGVPSVRRAVRVLFSSIFRSKKDI